MQHFDDAARRGQFRVRRDLQYQPGRKQEGHGDAHEGGQERAGHVKADDGLHAAARVVFALRHGVDDEEKDEQRRDAFQGFDEEVAENLHGRDGRREKDRQADAEDQADGNLLDQGHLGQTGCKETEQDNYLQGLRFTIAFPGEAHTPLLYRDFPKIANVFSGRTKKACVHDTATRCSFPAKGI